MTDMNPDHDRPEEDTPHDPFLEDPPLHSLARLIDWSFEDDPLAAGLVHDCAEVGVPDIPCLLHQSSIPYGNLSHGAQMFWFAFSHWIEFRYRARSHQMKLALRDLGNQTTQRCFHVIDNLPWQDRPPLLFSALLLAASRGQHYRETPIGDWLGPDTGRRKPEIRSGRSPHEAWLRPFPPTPLSLSVIERRILDEVASGRLTLPQSLPVSLEESPRRIWSRAASRQPSEHRLMQGALLSLDRFELLLRFLPAPFGILGNVGEAFDLIALAPRSFGDLKAKIVDEAMRRVEADSLHWSRSQADLTWFWSGQGARTQDGRTLSCDEVIERFTPREPEDGQTDHRKFGLRRAGSLLWRLGDRKGAMNCARELGYTPTELRWHLQTVSGSVHSRAHGLAHNGRAKRPAVNWHHEPALAASAMSVPLWLQDGKPRAAELKELFYQAADFPWIFPKLHHVYQWHLALDRDEEALEEIAEICPRFSVGLR